MKLILVNTLGQKGATGGDEFIWESTEERLVGVIIDKTWIFTLIYQLLCNMVGQQQQLPNSCHSIKYESPLNHS